jgi:hypothetical protein
MGAEAEALFRRDMLRELIALGPGRVEPAGHDCGVCGAAVFVGGDLTPADVYAACGNAGQSPGKGKTERPACPWRPGGER